MRVKEIREELKERGVSYNDCFDRESLVQRLVDARTDTAFATCTSSAGSDANTETAGACCAPPPKQPADTADNKVEIKPPSIVVGFDRDKVLKELRQMRVAELRSECGQRDIRWATMFEKEDLVQALLAAREAASNFSLSGALSPGEVGEVTGKDLQEELGVGMTPLLLDVYATWCGPCKQFAPHLSDAANELGDRLRVAKLDSDKYPDWTRKLNVNSFPTVILFDACGQEIERIEGAIMKPQIIQLVEPHIT